MPTNTAPLAAFADTKPHYNILDGLRGVAALMVVWFHVFEAYQTGRVDQPISHGYLAVDFFFILSGFVVAYAYDDRWNKMSTWNFLKRRLIRLQPMVVMGALIGGALFFFQDPSKWNTSTTTVGALIIATLLSALLIPVTPSVEARGFGEMFPLNGPSWSLLFEYIGNILYALFIRRFSTIALSILVGIAGAALASFAIFGPYGDICVGFQLSGIEFSAGFLRLLFSFSAGLLLFRVFKPRKIKGSFLISSLAVIALFSAPRFGGESNAWINGLYDAICVIALFPLIVYIGASGQIVNKTAAKVCKFLGDISYPLYIVHYPFIWVYYMWVKNNELTFSQSWGGAVALFFGCIALAYLCLKFYDMPVRKYLSAKFLKRSTTK